MTNLSFYSSELICAFQRKQAIIFRAIEVIRELAAMATDKSDYYAAIVICQKQSAECYADIEIIRAAAEG